MKTLDSKLAAIHADPAAAQDFILADAKDADMAFGLSATGVDPMTGRPRSLADFRDQMREVVRQGLVDIVLMSASTNDVLTREGLFADSAVTPAVRANDSTDIHVLAGAPYPQQPLTAVADSENDEIIAGRDQPGALLDHASWRRGTRRCGARGVSGLQGRGRAGRPASLLEVFAPNVPCRCRTSAASSTTSSPDAGCVPGLDAAVPESCRTAARRRWRNWSRTTASDRGVSAGRPHDLRRVPPAAGGPSPRRPRRPVSAQDNRSEHQLTFVRYLRAIADGEIDAAEACRSYHADLERLGIRPTAPLQDDLLLTDATIR